MAECGHVMVAFVIFSQLLNSLLVLFLTLTTHAVLGLPFLLDRTLFLLKHRCLFYIYIKLPWLSVRVWVPVLRISEKRADRFS